VACVTQASTLICLACHFVSTVQQGASLPPLDLVVVWIAMSAATHLPWAFHLVFFVLQVQHKLSVLVPPATTAAWISSPRVLASRSVVVASTVPMPQHRALLPAHNVQSVFSKVLVWQQGSALLVLLVLLLPAQARPIVNRVQLVPFPPFPRPLLARVVELEITLRPLCQPFATIVRPANLPRVLVRSCAWIVLREVTQLDLALLAVRLALLVLPKDLWARLLVSPAHWAPTLPQLDKLNVWCAGQALLLLQSIQSPAHLVPWGFSRLALVNLCARLAYQARLPTVLAKAVASCAPQVLVSPTPPALSA
jgi:hypothetical protein